MNCICVSFLGTSILGHWGFTGSAASGEAHRSPHQWAVNLGPELLLMAESGPVFCYGRSRLLPRMCVNYLTCSGCCSHHNSCCRHSLQETRCKGIGFTVGHSPGLRAPLPWQIKVSVKRFNSPTLRVSEQRPDPDRIVIDLNQLSTDPCSSHELLVLM